MSTRQKPARALPGSQAQATAGRTSLRPHRFQQHQGQVGPRARRCSPPAPMCRAMLLSIPQEGHWAPAGQAFCPGLPSGEHSDHGCLQHQMGAPTMELLCSLHPQWRCVGALHSESGELDPSLATFSQSLPSLPLPSHPQGDIPSGNLPQNRVPPLAGRDATEIMLDPTHCD